METPTDLSERLLEQSARFSELSDELSTILEGKPKIWLNIRSQTQSDTSAERTWAATPDGIQETILKLKLKALEKSMSAIKTRLRIASDEARNLY